MNSRDKNDPNTSNLRSVPVIFLHLFAVLSSVAQLLDLVFISFRLKAQLQEAPDSKPWAVILTPRCNLGGFTGLRLPSETNAVARVWGWVGGGPWARLLRLVAFASAFDRLSPCSPPACPGFLWLSSVVAAFPPLLSEFYTVWLYAAWILLFPLSRLDVDDWQVSDLTREWSTCHWGSLTSSCPFCPPHMCTCCVLCSSKHPEIICFLYFGLGWDEASKYVFLNCNPHIEKQPRLILATTKAAAAVVPPE